MQFNKGKTTYTELMDMPNRLFHSLYVKTINKYNSEQGLKEAAGEELMETLEEEVITQDDIKSY